MHPISGGFRIGPLSWVADRCSPTGSTCACTSATRELHGDWHGLHGYRVPRATAGCQDAQPGLARQRVHREDRAAAHDCHHRLRAAGASPDPGWDDDGDHRTVSPPPFDVRTAARTAANQRLGPLPLGHRQLLDAGKRAGGSRGRQPGDAVGADLPQTSADGTSWKTVGRAVAERRARVLTARDRLSNGVQCPGSGVVNRR